MFDVKTEEKMHDEIGHKPFTEDTKCVFVGGKMNGKVMTVAELRKTGSVTGKAKDWSEERGKMFHCPMEIFDNAPIVSGYIGPMWGGSMTPLRYETSEVYEQLSI